jgi:hypothetical protein
MAGRIYIPNIVGGALAAALALTGGCRTNGSQGTDASGSDASVCSLRTPPINGATTGDPVRDAAETQEMAQLDRLFGRYMRGDVDVYRGSIDAHDTQSIYSRVPPFNIYTDRTMTSDHAIASLVVDGTDSVTLTVFSPAEQEYVVFAQSSSAPGVTSANGILLDAQYGGQVATCSGCAPDFFSDPTTVAWTNQDAVVIDETANAPYHVVSTMSLQLASPCSLTWDDLAALDDTTYGDQGDRGLGFFAKVGNAMVLHKTGAVQTKWPSGSGACDGEKAPYTIDLYVNLANLSDYGVQNYVGGAPVVVCEP